MYFKDSYPIVVPIPTTAIQLPEEGQKFQPTHLPLPILSSADTSSHLTQSVIMKPSSKLFLVCGLLIISITFTLARPQNRNSLQHIAVIENDAYEQTLPYELKNAFYKTPRVREALAKSSWFGPGEEPVFDRQAEKIPRIEIYNVLAHAGLIPRKRQLF
ncbi:uncharacterized protein LOC119688295 [Teleopsis dalmanni]|uniref:uncharacterized protein LOC119688295 n=1 Tax=Teleopsis dalmanni TaxID=139649 RepID=UPI0018CE5132|nr:uncharacterized protein LOC119688295 [Teleopsis dalmanni]